MQYYSQKDYPKTLLGECKSTTIAQEGCFVTCLAMFAGITPPEVNDLLKEEGGFSANQHGVKCLINSPKATKILGLFYKGRSWSYPGMEDLPCIAEARINNQQHFVVLLDNGKVVDPLDRKPIPKKNPYFLYSYRLFKPIKENNPMPQDLSGGEIQAIVFGLLGHKMPKDEAEHIAKTKKAADYITELLQRSEHTKWIEKIGNAMECLENKPDMEQAEAKRKKAKEYISIIQDTLANLKILVTNKNLYV